MGVPRRRRSDTVPLPAPLDLSVFRQMADMSNDAFYLTDGRGRFLYVNDRAKRLGGYSREELLRMSVSDINPDFPVDRLRAYLTALAAGTAPTQFETISRRKDGSIYPIEITVAHLVVAGATYTFGVVRDISERKEIEAAQRSLAQRMLQTLEAERQRVARELHDDVGQAIATVGVLLHTIETAAGTLPDEARATLAAAHATLGRIIESVARISRDHHPAELRDLGLEDTLRGHARQFAQRHQLRMRLDTTDVRGLLAPDHELHVYRIVQEALANVARHAHATRVALRLAHDRQWVVVTVRDDGVGLEPGRGRPGGLGLVTMRERAELMHAELAVRSLPAGGTEVRLRVPLATRPEAAASGSAPRPAARRAARRQRSTRRGGSTAEPDRW